MIDAGLRPVICSGVDVGTGIGAIKTRQAQRKQEAKPDDKSAGGFRLWAGLAVCVGQNLELRIFKFRNIFYFSGFLKLFKKSEKFLEIK